MKIREAAMPEACRRKLWLTRRIWTALERGLYSASIDTVAKL
jgi:hypothetical protein